MIAITRFDTNNEKPYSVEAGHDSFRFHPIDDLPTSAKGEKPLPS
ncbi:hypothetical protein ACQKPX_10140 [Photobacterium sp. DNB23_23_1]